MSRSRLDWFPFYADDWLMSHAVREMDLEERGAYATLMAEAWREGGSLPDRPRLLARMLGVSQKQVERLLSGPLGECWEKEGDRLVNRRLAEERARAEGVYESRRRAGRSRGRSTKPAPEAQEAASERSDALVEPSTCSANAEREPSVEAASQVHPNLYIDTDTTATAPDPPNSPPAGGPVEEPKKEPKPRRKRADVIRDLVAPGAEFEQLSCDAMEEWCAHLDERLDKARTRTGALRFLKQVREMGPRRFRAAVEHSVAGNYQGLYEPKGRDGGAKPRGDDVVELVQDGKITILDLGGE